MCYDEKSLCSDNVSTGKIFYVMELIQMTLFNMILGDPRESTALYLNDC